MGCPECKSNDYELESEYGNIQKDVAWETYICNKCGCCWRVTMAKVIIKHGST